MHPKTRLRLLLAWPHLSWCAAVVIGLGSVAAGCTSKGDDPARQSCEGGFELVAGSCEACPPWTSPREGGGCACFDGFEYEPTKRTCEPVLPAAECPPNTMPVLGKRECQPVGVAAAGGCAAGFVADGRGGCSAILPKGDCEPGTMAVPGDTACREIAPCGEGLWGEIADEPGALYVSKAFAGGASDGSREKPYTTIQAAVDAAKPGNLIAVADGSYEEDVDIKKPLRLRGRCPAKVEVKGTNPTGATLSLWSTSAKISVAALSVTGRGTGIGVARGNAEIEAVFAHDLGMWGIAAVGRQATLSVRRSLIARSNDRGISVVGAKATIDATAVHATKSGPGVLALFDTMSGASSEMVLRGSLVAGNREGILVVGSTAAVEATLVQGTLAAPGIAAKCTTGSCLPANLVVRGTVVANAHDVGIGVYGSKASIETTFVHHTLANDGQSGQGIVAAAQPGAAAADLTVRATTVDASAYQGIAVLNSRASLESSIVRGTVPAVVGTLGQLGRGIEAQQSVGGLSELAIRGVLVEANAAEGVFLVSTNSTIDASVIRKNGSGGIGAKPLAGPTFHVHLTGTLVDSNAVTGLGVFGTRLTLEGCLVRDTGVDANGRFGRGIDVSPTGTIESDLLVRGTLVERNHDLGISIFGSRAMIERSIVRETRNVGGAFGDGIGVVGRPYGQDLLAAEVTVHACLVEGNARVGLAAFADATVHTDATRLTCNEVDLARIGADLDGKSYEAQFDTSAGANSCGCNTAASCKVESKDVKEIPPPGAAPPPSR